MEVTLYNKYKKKYKIKLWSASLVVLLMASLISSLIVIGLSFSLDNKSYLYSLLLNVKSLPSINIQTNVNATKLVDNSNKNVLGNNALYAGQTARYILKYSK